MHVLLLILVIPVLLVGCAVLIMRVPLPRGLPPPASRGRNLMAAITTGILGLVCLAALTAYVLSLLRVGGALDTVCSSLGLTARGYALFGRQYQGTVGGRPVEINFFPSWGLNPARLNLYVGGKVGTRLALAQRKPLLDCGGCARLEEPSLGHLHILAEDEPTARDLLADPAVRTPLERLIDRMGNRGELYLQPDRLWLRFHPRRLGEGEFRQLLDDLLTLADSVGE